MADSFLNNAPTNVGFTLLWTWSGKTDQNGNPIQILHQPKSCQSSQRSSRGERLQQSLSGWVPERREFRHAFDCLPGFAAPAIVTAAGKLHYPTYEEYSFQVEQALDPRKQTVLSLSYVGNHGYHEPVQNQSVNAFGVNNGSPGFDGVTPINFTGLPTTIPNPSFGAANEVGNGAVSNYNGFLVGVSRHTKSLTLNFNYTWSHALDEISNGGILGFGHLERTT